MGREGMGTVRTGAAWQAWPGAAWNGTERRGVVRQAKYHKRKPRFGGAFYWRRNVRDAITGRQMPEPIVGKTIRGGSGLGDSLYCRPIVDFYRREGHQVVVKSDYPEVFAGSGARVERFTRDGCNVVAHYSGRKAIVGTNQWQDVCASAGVGDLPLSIPWQILNRPLVNDLKGAASGRPIVMVNGGRAPMGRQDGYGREMLPRKEAFHAVLRALDGCFTIEVGKGPEVYPLATDLDLTGKTTPADLLDIASISRGLVGQCSFMIPLAESLDRPLLVVWAAAGLESSTEFIRLCRPEKIISKATSRWVMDDWSEAQIAEAVDAFRGAIRA